MRSLGLIPCVLGSFAACASAPTDRTTSHAVVEAQAVTGTVRFDFDPEGRSSADNVRMPAANAWAALPQAYASLGLETVVHAAVRAVTSQSNVRRTLGGVRLSRMLDCGSAMGSPRADNYTISLFVETRVDSLGPAETVLRTRVQATGHDISVNSHSVQCSTSGHLEREIANTVQELAR